MGWKYHILEISHYMYVDGKEFMGAFVVFAVGKRLTEVSLTTSDTFLSHERESIDLN